jgi:transcriptional regulator with XRE-family HTH domain
MLDKRKPFFYYNIIMNETEELKAYQKRSGERIEEIARAIGVSNRTIYNWLAGDIGRIHPLMLRRLRLFLARKRRDAMREKPLSRRTRQSF